MKCADNTREYSITQLGAPSLFQQRPTTLGCFVKIFLNGLNVSPWIQKNSGIYWPPPKKKPFSRKITTNNSIQYVEIRYERTSPILRTLLGYSVVQFGERRFGKTSPSMLRLKSKSNKKTVNILLSLYLNVGNRFRNNIVVNFMLYIMVYTDAYVGLMHI